MLQCLHEITCDIINFNRRSRRQSRKEELGVISRCLSEIRYDIRIRHNLHLIQDFLYSIQTVARKIQLRSDNSELRSGEWKSFHQSGKANKNFIAFFKIVSHNTIVSGSVSINTVAANLWEIQREFSAA